MGCRHPKSFIYKKPKLVHTIQNFFESECLERTSAISFHHLPVGHKSAEFGFPFWKSVL